MGDRVGVGCLRPWIGEECGEGRCLCAYCACRGMLCVFCGGGGGGRGGGAL